MKLSMSLLLTVKEILFRFPLFQNLELPKELEPEKIWQVIFLEYLLSGLVFWTDSPFSLLLLGKSPLFNQTGRRFNRVTHSQEIWTTLPTWILLKPKWSVDMPPPPWLFFLLVFCDWYLFIYFLNTASLLLYPSFAAVFSFLRYHVPGPTSFPYTFLCWVFIVFSLASSCWVFLVCQELGKMLKMTQTLPLESPGVVETDS